MVELGQLTMVIATKRDTLSRQTPKPSAAHSQPSYADTTERAPFVGETRASLVRTIRRADPALTLEQIGRKVGLTRERVRQILADAGLPTKNSRFYHFCVACGTPVSRDRKYCETCHKDNIASSDIIVGRRHWLPAYLRPGRGEAK